MKTSSPSISSSSSLSLFTSSHIFFPPDLTSVQCSSPKNHELQAHYPQKEPSDAERKYTKDPSNEKNVSSGKIDLFTKSNLIFSLYIDLRQEAESALHLALRLMSENKIEKARKVFEHALTLDPYNSEILVEYGQFLEYHQKDLIRAENLYTRALVQQPTNPRALELKQRTLPLVEEIDQKHFTFIDNLLQELYRIPDTNPYLRRAKRDAYYLHIYHSNAIEGNTLNLRETRHIVETRMAIGGKSLIEQQEVLGLDLALQYVNCTLVNRLGSITREDIFEIHRRVLGFVDPVEAGQLRTHQVYVGSFVPPGADDVPAYLDDFLIWLNSLEDTQDLHAIELAAIAHYKFVYIHPFIDGNGRTGRLLMNLILMRSGFPPVIIKKSERLAYYSYLDQANDGDVRPLIRFIAKCTERTLTEFIHQSQPTRTTGQELSLTDDDDGGDDGISFIEERVIMV
jgi:fido (protein-threonine AMPylation protein)